MVVLKLTRRRLVFLAAICHVLLCLMISEDDGSEMSSRRRVHGVMIEWLCRLLGKAMVCTLRKADPQEG